jgi:hypothetical protein
MKPRTRACVAFIAGSFITGKPLRSVYDHGQGKHINFSGSIQKGTVNVYDHDAGCHISGNVDQSKLALFHHGNTKHLNIDINGSQFNGYDYDTGHFQGTVNGASVTIFDHGEGAHFSYSLS